MKYAVMGVLRSCGLLPLVDQLQFHRRRFQASRTNRAFLRDNPGFAAPPEALAFDAYNNVDWVKYDAVGHAHAAIMVDAMNAHAAPGPLDILEWGCGPGRLLRQMPGLLGDRLASLTGTDYNPDTVAWCQTEFPAIRFATNALMPPLPHADASFDVVYNFSVFTHLSEAAHTAWTAELRRVLRPGGILLSTTHGDAYRYLLSRAEEQAAYDRGELVTQDGVDEGKKFYFAIHPQAYVRDRMFADFVDVEMLPVPADADLLQSLWVARRPLEPAA